jgi:outer membrane protein OmpA-like peptidoglycan-associated protein
MLLGVAVLALGVGSSACATKKYVNTQVGEVNDKVTTLSKSVEETQDRTRRNEQRIGDVDKKADAAGQRADAAGKSAMDARSAADAVGGRVTELDKMNRRLIYEVVLTDDQARFNLAKADLSPEAQASLDKLVQQLAADPKNYYIEIEGHTDATGADAYNERLGLQRAEAVKRYLYEKHNVPLHKINVISFGETKPIAPNKTREGRAQNRRVVVKVLA